MSSGFGYAIRTGTDDPDEMGTVSMLQEFQFPVCFFVYVLFYHFLTLMKKNGLARAARARDGLDVVIRVIVIGNEGHDHLKILRTIATGENSLFSNNHALPMFAEFQFEDVIFGIFPKVGGEITDAYGYWAKNSVGDIIEMLMQMLEVSFTSPVLPLLNLNYKALTFIHDLNIAHRVSTLSDGFFANISNPPAVSRMRSVTTLSFNGIQSRCTQ